jgi:hypothetical protein
VHAWLTIGLNARIDALRRRRRFSVGRVLVLVLNDPSDRGRRVIEQKHLTKFGA